MAKRMAVESALSVFGTAALFVTTILQMIVPVVNFLLLKDCFAWVWTELPKMFILEKRLLVEQPCDDGPDFQGAHSTCRIFWALLLLFSSTCNCAGCATW